MEDYQKCKAASMSESPEASHPQLLAQFGFPIVSIESKQEISFMYYLYREVN